MKVHVRHPFTTSMLCGQPAGSSISLDHYRQNPSAHIGTLDLCDSCAWQADHTGVAPVSVAQEKDLRRKAADGCDHRCLPPRWPVTPDLRMCRWFGHRVTITIGCCRYVLKCDRCLATLADLPRGDEGMVKSDGSLPMLFKAQGPPEAPPNTRVRRGLG